MVKEIVFGEIDGIRVGHAENLEAGTGCTVVICEEGATAGVDVRGGAPGTRETDLLNPVNLVQAIHAVLLTGGSAFGLDAASGVMQFLEERGIGFDVQVTRVPIVCGAALFDLAIGDHTTRPDREMGYQACLNAERNITLGGNVGAGTGATVGKVLGMSRAMKSGLGTFAVQTGDLKVGAIVAVNALGDVVDPDTGEKLAGLLTEDLQGLADTEEVLVRSSSGEKNLFGGSTTIAVVATNASLSKARMAKVASMAQNGFAQTLRPAHSMFDGDTTFAVGTGRVDSDVNAVGLLAARTVARAVAAAVKSATPLFGLKTHSDLRATEAKRFAGSDA